jgi:hypothetical protein
MARAPSFLPEGSGAIRRPLYLFVSFAGAMIAPGQVGLPEVPIKSKTKPDAAGIPPVIV